MATVYVLTHTDKKERTRVIGVYSNTAKCSQALTKESAKGNLNPLEFFFYGVTLDRAVTR